MGLIKTSIFILLVAIGSPLMWRNFAPDSAKTQFNAYVSQHKTIDQMLKQASGYLDSTLEYVPDVERVKSAIDSAKVHVDHIVNLVGEKLAQSKSQSEPKAKQGTETKVQPKNKHKAEPVIQLEAQQNTRQETKPKIQKESEPKAQEKKTTVEQKSQQPRKVTCQQGQENLLLLTKEELSKFDGNDNSSGNKLYLAFLGNVYDVSRNRKHYAQGGDYAFFSAKDATRAFLTGNFQPSDLIDNLDGVAHEQYRDVDHWMSFYGGEYPLIGRVIGEFYNDQGCATEKLANIHKIVSEIKKQDMERKTEDYKFPECNAEWNGETKKSRVWCSTMSGGIERDWIGVPRKLYQQDSKSFRCVCIRDSGPSSSGGDANIGDLAHPRLQEYEGCDSKANECLVA